MKILATDIGYGHTKYAFGDKPDKFPTLIAPTDEYDTVGEKEGLLYNNKTYLVGDSALDSNTIIVTRSDNFLLNYSPVFIYEILRRLDFPEVDIISVSLSILEFKKSRESMEKKCSKFIVNDRLFENRIVVVPQGMGIWWQMGNPSNAVIVDIGYNTVDVLTMRNSQPKTSKSFALLDYGVVKLVNDIVIYVNDKYKTNIEEHDANLILANNGKFKIFRQQQDISDFVADKKEEYSKRLIEKIRNDNRTEGLINKIDNLIFAGGGAYYIDNTTKEKYGIQIPENPVFANVEGFIKLVENSYIDKNSLSIKQGD